MEQALQKLPEVERQKIKKHSDERLKGMLLSADYAPEEVEKMDRATLLETWAQVVLLRSSAAAEGAGDKGRWEFEKYKFDQQMELERMRTAAQLELAKQQAEREAAEHQAREAAQLELARQQAEREAVERQARFELEKEKMRMEHELAKARLDFDSRKHQ